MDLDNLDRLVYTPRLVSIPANLACFWDCLKRHFDTDHCQYSDKLFTPWHNTHPFYPSPLTACVSCCILWDQQTLMSPHPSLGTHTGITEPFTPAGGYKLNVWHLYHPRDACLWEFVCWGWSSVFNPIMDIFRLGLVMKRSREQDAWFLLDNNMFVFKRDASVFVSFSPTQLLFSHPAPSLFK